MKPVPCPFCRLHPKTKVTRYPKSLKIKPIFWVKCQAVMGGHSCFVTSDVSNYDAVKKWNDACASWKLEAFELKRQVAAANLKLAQATQYAQSIAAHMARHWSGTSPRWIPLEDIGGILTQIDNMAAGMTRRLPNG